ncbi:glycogen debranching protein GlgX [Prosthecomicrobium pneumaticum]|uniref:Glycogen operon protein n=1 Tax=Prosthecomicrobium pneumaticum TaxID=81895 RepID=A0A7W9FPA1_9HYPH|nr:glycogen debranching protein GlgX [Prosthecomicrobium pneumaticum]MBB5754378.1 glycogen operon protein [Prosthecomicrobium pneumaticum]
MSRITPGYSHPLGATEDEGGVNFALFSDNAEGVVLCLYDESGQNETERIPVTECTNGVWHVHVGGVHRGQVYGYRVYGPWAPEQGHRFNDAKLLIDPYAKALVGDLVWDDAVYGYPVGPGDDADLTKDERDSAPFVPKARVVGKQRPAAPRRPPIPWHKTVIYEAHTRGLTMQCPLVPEDSRGTFDALGEPALLDYLVDLGVTTVELLPVHAFVQDRHLVERGLSNYWGYNTLNFFAPERRYLGEAELESIGRAVDQIHEAGLELILDVVYNHTGEGNHLGPTMSFKGIDNASYYRLLPDQPRFYDNLTGTGNALNTDHPRVLQMVMDSLRHWATAYEVDGFRFDLATTLGRRPTGFDPGHAFFAAILQDPVLGGMKLIAEPWDVGPGGYQLGNFPAGFSEWNGDYRDVVREFWIGGEGLLGAFATRFAASNDLFGDGRRRPWSSVNFITAHDGFTLHDLVSYNDKHNEANGENNQDGHSDNKSWNCGAEGETEDEGILRLRAQQKRNLIATLFLSQGVPMLLAGDELGNSQGGNNNAYCQDNEIGWVDWSKPDGELTAFVKKMIRLRAEHSVLSRPEFATGARNSRGQPDIAWFSAGGERMSDKEWSAPHVKCLTVRLAPQREGEASLLILLNGSDNGVHFRIPKDETPQWRCLVDTADGAEGEAVKPGDERIVPPRGLQVWAGRLPPRQTRSD